MSSWAPTYLTLKEYQQIEAEGYRDLGMEPPTPRQRFDPTWQAEFFKKIDAWTKANPGKPWGLDRLIEADRK